MSDTAHPTGAAGITVEYLNGLVHEVMPEASVTAVEIVDAKAYGEAMVSTAGRALLALRWGEGSPPDLPEQVVLKVAHGTDTVMSAFYENEVAFYRKIRPELSIEAPRCFGARYDAGSGTFGLLLENLSVRGARFPNVTERVEPETTRALLAVLATLHAQYWESPRFDAGGDLAWVGTHVGGGVSDMLNRLAPPLIQQEIDTENFKREMVQRLRTTGPELLAGTQAMQRHQATLPCTLLHGDTHLGNTYLLPDGTAGFLDWQLMVHGHHMHDVNYLITTSLSIGDRRDNERELVREYLDRLGPVAPSFEDAWRAYRMSLVWGVYIGWLTTPVTNYGWEINVLNHLRLTTAFEDHDVLPLVRGLM